MRYFWIVDGMKPKRAKPCGLLIYDEVKKEFAIQISPDAGPEDVPMMFVPFLERDERELPPDWALEWVRERIPPANRQNIGEILQAHGLDEYDEFALLLSGEGACSQDNFMIREVVPTWEGNPDFYSYALVELPSRTSSMLREAVGEAVRKARRNAHMSQEELCRKSGVPRATISNIENAAANPTLDTVASLIDALGVNPMFKLF